MNITDLSFDGLERCLQHLDIADLLNIADCNEQLRHAARYLIARDIRQTEVTLHINDRIITNPDCKFTLDKKRFCMGGDLKFCLQFLRCCGDLISEMYISTWQQKNSVVCDQVVNYVNEYCSGFLIKMKISLCTRGTLRSLTKPFGKVEQIKIHNSSLTDIKLSELFPNVRKIKFTRIYLTREVSTFPKDFWTDHYPRLEHLTIFVYLQKHYYYKNVSILLRENPQLKSFSSNINLRTMFDGSKSFPYANEFLQNLEKLHLNEIDCDDTIDERIHLKSLKEFSFKICARQESMWTFPFVCDQLESLDIAIMPENGENFLSRITDYPKNIKKLIFESSSYNDHMEISKVFPSLVEIDLTSWYHFYFTVDEIVRFVHQFRSLKLLQVRSLPEISTKELVARFGSAWSVSFESRNVLYVASSHRKLYLSIKLERA